ncbi:hypothetical protein V2S66_21080 [Streptomyces sp. V4-01]|uniref:Uncharacterized protein n=1 Tax=Actinacidiphila polyblastidii TaxID=3110430 RepID=A0ABU7PF68_9ACTN|nr:hypothetical protein [Streptomyces sp. V4-01]
MNTGNRSEPGGTSAFEEELVAAMGEFADRERPPAFDPRSMVRARSRGSRRLAAGVVTLAAAATAAVLLLTAGGGGQPGPAPVPPATGAAVSPSPTAVDGSLPPPGAGSVDQDTALLRLFTAAAMSRSQDTTRRVDLPEVMSLFADAHSYQQVWGTDGSGVTCGTRPDGVVVDSPDDVLLYRGTSSLHRRVAVAFDDSGRITGVTCGVPYAHGGDPAVAARYGAMVGAGHAPVDCGRPRPRLWLAHAPASGTVVHGWTLALDGGAPFTVGVDGAGKVTVHCTA